jgi:hypothetical protein
MVTPGLGRLGQVRPGKASLIKVRLVYVRLGEIRQGYFWLFRVILG